MSDYLIKSETLTDIANAIRGKTGSASPIKAQDFATEIEGIQAGGGGGDIDGLIDGTLTEITSNATSIRQYAFYNWSTLTSVYFPQMTNITGKYAFQNTFNSMGITQDSFPIATEIGEYVFYSSKINSANFSRVTTIGSGAFSNCTNLTNVDFAEALTTGNSVFESCSKLVSVNLPKLTHLGANAFSRCSSLETIDLPEVVTLGSSSSGGVFSSCSKLKLVNLPKLQRLSMAFFSSCKALTEVYLPQVSGQITKSAFSSCNALETAILPKCTEISSSVFSDCYSLKKLVLGTEATTNYAMGNTNCFSNCYHIKGTVNATYNPNGDKDGYIYVPLSRVAEVRTKTNWVTYATQIMPWVATREELDSIDNTLYDHACVGEVEYIYDGDSWRIFR